MASSGMLRRVVLVTTDVSEECRASMIRATTIGEVGTTLAVTSYRRTLRSRRKIHDDGIFHLRIYLDILTNAREELKPYNWCRGRFY
jgi:hypothetical protein